MMTTTTNPQGVLCGNCKSYHPNALAVRACYSMAVNSAWGLEPERPVEPDTDMPCFAEQLGPVPDSKYALERAGQIQFFEVDTGREGTKWAGMRFVTRLVGAPGQWAEYPVKGSSKVALLADIAKDAYTDPESGEVLHGAKAAAVRYSREFTVCAKCGSPLSDPESMARGLGPICAGYFG